MTTRDRLVVMGLVVLGMLAAGWLVVVTPERNQAAQLEAQVDSAHQQLTSAQTQLSQAQSAQAQYPAAYASMVRLGKAVPADQQVPSLVYELDQASSQRYVEFNSIATASSGSSGGAPSASSTTAAAVSGGFTQMPFTFIFNGSFAALYRLMSQIQGFTVRTTAGAVHVSGRLLTIQSADLELKKEQGGAGTGVGGEHLTGTIAATAYVLPASQGLTWGATPAGPTGASTQTVSGPAASSPPAAPAVVKVTP